jgi:hypothetical protein
MDNENQRSLSDLIQELMYHTIQHDEPGLIQESLNDEEPITNTPQPTNIITDNIILEDEINPEERHFVYSEEEQEEQEEQEEEQQGEQEEGQGGETIVPPIPIPPMIQFIIGGMGPTPMDIMERSFQEQKVKDTPACPEFLKTLKEITFDSSQEYSCAICQENLQEGESMYELPCNGIHHYFHKGDDPEKCQGILPWFQINHTCPVCRTEFPHIEVSDEEGNSNEEENDNGGDNEEENDGNLGEMRVNVPLHEVIRAGGFQQMMTQIVNGFEEQMYEDEIQQAIMRSYEES